MANTYSPLRQRSTRTTKACFVAGICSQIAKLDGLYSCSNKQVRQQPIQGRIGHPFNTIKVRLQFTEKSQFPGSLHYLAQTVRNVGLRGLYKGATPPCNKIPAVFVKGFKCYCCVESFGKLFATPCSVTVSRLHI